MKTQWSRYILIAITILSITTNFFVPVMASGISSPEAPLTIDFDTVLVVPQELRKPIEEAMTSGRSLLPDSNYFMVTALRQSDGWAQAILVPKYIVEAQWEIEIKPNEIIELLGQQTALGEFHFSIEGTSDAAKLKEEIPQEFVDFSTSMAPSSTTNVDYLFPWTSGQNWYKTQGWHSGNSLDFQPVTRTNPAIHFAVLAAAGGKLTRICGGPGTNDPYQTILQIEHADGTTKYTHLDANSIRQDLLGQNVVRGQFLGLLYNGTQGGGGGYQYSTPCGYGTAVHLHFTLPRQDLTIDGQNANSVSASAFATQYRSSNTRTDNGSGDSDGGQISYGQTRTGTVNPAQDTDDYSFNGTAGEIVEIRMNKASGSSLDSYLELRGPNNYLASDDDGGGSLNSFLRRTLPASGQYTIRTRGYGSSTGAYTISLTKSTSCGGDCEGDPRWIAFGQTTNGTINPNSDRDTYYFSGTSGRVISIQLNKTSGALDPYLELWSPSGVKLKVNDDGGGSTNSLLVHTLPSNGTYRIIARSWNTSSSGTYSIKLESVTGSGGSSNLARGKSVRVSSVEFSGVEGWKATDGSISTRWSSRFSDPQWIYVDLGQNRTFNQVVLKWESAYARRFGIYVWTGSRWQNVYWTSSGRGGTNTINFSPRTARYVLMEGFGRGTSWGYSLWEFEVYDTTSTVMPDVPPDDPEKVDGADPVTPLSPVEGEKDVLLSGDGEYGQEETPLANPEEAQETSEQLGESQSVVAFINSPSELDAWFVPFGYLRFEGIASSQVGTATIPITAYNWRSDRSGEIGTQALFTVPVTSLLPGTHTISFKAQNELGTWSEEVTKTLTVTWPYQVYLPLSLKVSTP